MARREPRRQAIALSDPPALLSIVGVVKNARQSDWTSEPGDEVYLPYLQRPGWKRLTFVVRTRTNPEAPGGNGAAGNRED